jgi:hypothetical protein
MKSRRVKILLLILLGYLVTWLGAPPLARRACTARANQFYLRAAASEKDYRETTRQFGGDPNLSRPFVTPGGPSIEFGRAVPILPGVLLLSNGYQLGPLNGKGQLTFFLYYGFGVCRLLDLTTWIS